MKRRELPLVYACSGCSSVAQLANDAAVHLDHQGKAEMSCISGVGGGVPALVKTAQSGRSIIAIDGCQMHCVVACLAKCGVEADQHVKLYEQGHKKRLGEKASAEDFDGVIEQLEQRLKQL
ncbi:MAG: putative zinc-binding protein [Pontibacterium sp.]